MKTLFTIASLLLLSLCVKAQPVLTAVANNPIAGDTFCLHGLSLAGVDIGDSGAAAVWDYSNDTVTGSVHRDYLNCASTAYCDSFPGSNLANNTFNIFEYYICDAGRMSYTGSATLGFSGADITKLQDPGDLIRYPFSYGDVFTDTSGALISGYYTGEIVVVKGDGYGTLKLPEGIYDNALRVHKVVKSYTIVSGVWQINHQSDVYLWYVPGFHDYVAYMQLDTAGGTNHIIGAGYNAGVLHTLAVQQLRSAITGFTLSPNPAGENVNIRFDLYGKTSDATLAIYDYAGKQMIVRKDLVDGTNNISLYVGDLPVGVYMVRLASPQQSLCEKLVVGR